jgi:hypothetical protein
VKIPVVAGAGVAVAAGVTELVVSGSPLRAVGAVVAGAIAAALVWFVTTLPGLSLRGLLTGGFFVGAGILSWTAINHGWLVWPVLAAEGILFAVWSWPWLRNLPAVPRLGTAWLGLAYWIIGIAGALLMLRLEVTAQRVAYAGVFGLAVLAVVANARRRDLSVGIVGAFLLAIAALTLAGSGNLFESIHAVPDSHWGTNQEKRFWGGPWLLYHPNSLALIGVVAAMRIGVDRAFAQWQRITVTVLAGGVLLATNSRSGLVYFVAAAVVHAFLLLRGRGADLPSYRRVWVAAAVPFVVAALVLGVSGGLNFVMKSRYGGNDPTSGRVDTWTQVGRDWSDAPVVEKVFGDTKTSRAVVHRADDGTKPGEAQLNLTTDNAAVGALRRGGVLGVAAFLVGLGLMLWRAARRDAPAWFTVAAVGSLVTIPVADWLLGTTGGTLWILLVAGEAWLLFGARLPAPTADVGLSTGVLDPRNSGR